jgi:glyoxylate carboligase
VVAAPDVAGACGDGRVSAWSDLIMQVSEAIARAVALECPGAPVFSLIGDANLQIVGALDRHTNAAQCFARDEGAAVAMADGYAQASAKLGVATVTSGPGLTHAATSLLGASRLHTPLVVVAGDTSMRRPTGIQEMQSIDQRRFVEACEAHFQALRSPLSLADDIASAFYRARSERAPLVLSVPLDLQPMELADGWTYQPFGAEPHAPEPGPGAVRTILETLRAAQRAAVQSAPMRATISSSSVTGLARCSGLRCSPRVCLMPLPGTSGLLAASAAPWPWISFVRPTPSSPLARSSVISPPKPDRCCAAAGSFGSTSDRWRRQRRCRT